ncbi:MAG: hypothetical protein KDI37_02280 [Xanthomonadales bacterium]|nr:hypothetical protein [Xanthomonadales bacterium]MCB1640530.1 hypothetical protein [Xanthomonadales bacterium]
MSLESADAGSTVVTQVTLPIHIAAHRHPGSQAGGQRSAKQPCSGFVPEMQRPGFRSEGDRVAVAQPNYPDGRSPLGSLLQQSLNLE